MKEKSIWIRNRTLEITKNKSDYIINDSHINIIIHADRLDFNAAKPPMWIYLFGVNNDYIGCIWVETQKDVDTLNEFLEDKE